MFSVRRFASVTALALTALMLPVSSALAQTPAFSFTSDAAGFEDNAADAGVDSYSLGFEFTANSSHFVTSLGYFYDPSFDPTLSFGPHQVGLYSDTGTLLASASVTLASTPNGDFLYAAITPVALVSGSQYVLAGVTGATDPYLFDVQDSQGNYGLSVDPAIAYGQDRYTVSSTLAFPGSTDPVSEPGFFGPNLLLSPVPEASPAVSLGLLLLGLAGQGLRARRRAR